MAEHRTTRETTDPSCTDARQWLSAFRDGEAMLDGPARAHLDNCSGCTSWEQSLDGLTRRLVVRSASAPDVTAAALVAWAQQPTSTAGELLAGRIALALAGVVGVVLAALTLVQRGVGVHLSQDLAAMEAALAVGFLLAAWRPHRYGRALLPVSAVAGALTLLASTGDVTGTAANLLVEASHLPILLGLGGLFLLLDAAAGGRGGRMTGRGR